MTTYRRNRPRQRAVLLTQQAAWDTLRYSAVQTTLQVQRSQLRTVEPLQEHRPLHSFSTTSEQNATLASQQLLEDCSSL